MRGLDRTYDWALLLPLALPPDLPPVILVDLVDSREKWEREGWMMDEGLVVNGSVSGGSVGDDGWRKEEAEGPLGIK